MSEQSHCTCSTNTEMSPSPLKRFPTGSSYNGAFDANGMSGYGEYTFPHGVVYRGEFEDGLFHGNGELVYNKGPEAKTIIRGHWVKGVMRERKFILNGTLEYDEHDWKYCKLPDRRYRVEYETGLLPAGKPLLTPDGAPREIPAGFYDAESGFYDPKKKLVCDYERKSDVLRGPFIGERKWIQDNCRKNPLGSVGPRPDFYETWSAPVIEPAPLPNPLVGFMKSKSSSLLDQDYKEGMLRPLYYDSSQVDLQRFESLSSKIECL